MRESLTSKVSHPIPIIGRRRLWASLFAAAIALAGVLPATAADDLQIFAAELANIKRESKNLEVSDKIISQDEKHTVLNSERLWKKCAATKAAIAMLLKTKADAVRQKKLLDLFHEADDLTGHLWNARGGWADWKFMPTHPFGSADPELSDVRNFLRDNIESELGAPGMRTEVSLKEWSARGRRLDGLIVQLNKKIALEKDPLERDYLERLISYMRLAKKRVVTVMTEYKARLL